MNKRKLGRTNLHLSELSLSTLHFGWLDDETTSLALLDAYHQAGGSVIQSQGICASGAIETTPTDTRSEEILGRWHQSRGISRDSLILATNLSLIRPAVGGSIAMANLIRESCENSLRRLRTKHIDLLVCEWDENLVPIDDTLEAVDRLIRAGIVRYAVAGGFPPWRVVDSVSRSSIRNLSRFEALQADYSLMTRARFEGEALPMCGEYRLGFIARAPLAGGFLAKPPSEIAPAFWGGDQEWLNERFGSNYGDVVLSSLSEIAAKRDVSPAQIALAWVLHNSQVTSALMTATSERELADLLSATEMRLSEAELQTLSRVTSVQDYRMELRHA